MATLRISTTLVLCLACVALTSGRKAAVKVAAVAKKATPARSSYYLPPMDDCRNSCTPGREVCAIMVASRTCYTRGTCKPYAQCIDSKKVDRGQRPSPQPQPRRCERLCPFNSRCQHVEVCQEVCAGGNRYSCYNRRQICKVVEECVRVFDNAQPINNKPDIVFVEVNGNQPRSIGQRGYMGGQQRGQRGGVFERDNIDDRGFQSSRGGRFQVSGGYDRADRADRVDRVDSYDRVNVNRQQQRDNRFSVQDSYDRRGGFSDAGFQSRRAESSSFRNEGRSFDSSSNNNNNFRSNSRDFEGNNFRGESRGFESNNFRGESRGFEGRRMDGGSSFRGEGRGNVYEHPQGNNNQRDANPTQAPQQRGPSNSDGFDGFVTVVKQAPNVVSSKQGGGATFSVVYDDSNGKVIPAGRGAGAIVEFEQQIEGGHPGQYAGLPNTASKLDKILDTLANLGSVIQPAAQAQTVTVEAAPQAAAMGIEVVEAPAINNAMGQTVVMGNNAMAMQGGAVTSNNVMGAVNNMMGGAVLNGAMNGVMGNAMSNVMSNSMNNVMTGNAGGNMMVVEAAGLNAGGLASADHMMPQGMMQQGGMMSQNMLTRGMMSEYAEDMMANHNMLGGPSMMSGPPGSMLPMSGGSNMMSGSSMISGGGSMMAGDVMSGGMAMDLMPGAAMINGMAFKQNDKRAPMGAVAKITKNLTPSQVMMMASTECKTICQEGYRCQDERKLCANPSCEKAMWNVRPRCVLIPLPAGAREYPDGHPLDWALNSPVPTRAAKATAALKAASRTAPRRG